MKGRKFPLITKIFNLFSRVLIQIHKYVIGVITILINLRFSSGVESLFDTGFNRIVRNMCQLDFFYFSMAIFREDFLKIQRHAYTTKISLIRTLRS